jgi:hypothetical protein
MNIGFPRNTSAVQKQRSRLFVPGRKRESAGGKDGLNRKGLWLQRLDLNQRPLGYE